MKRKEMERILRSYGFFLVRTNKHLIYSNGVISVALPSRAQYTKGLSRRVLQQAKLDKVLIKELLD